MKKLVLFIVTFLTMATTSFAQIGSADKDLVFTPITPCRIVDTRFAAGGPVMAGSTRVFKAWAATYTAQGGSASNCGILQSNDVAALALNLLVIVPSGEGFIKAWPVGVAQPNASTLNYKTNDVLANSATLKVSQVSGDWNLYSVSTTHFAADVVGYYSKPISNGSLECMDTSLVSVPINSGPVNSLYFNFLAAPACPVGYTQVSLRCMVSDSTSSASESITGHCNGTSSAIGANLYASKTCCRIPGR
jgi:hypothetical protein